MLHKTFFKACVSVAVFACGSLLNAPVIADEGALEEIIVTAQKREQSLQSIPISIKALTDKVLEKVNADSMDDIARMVPSLSMTDNSRGGSNVQIRGLGSNVASVGTVAIYNDGIISAGRNQANGTFAEQDPGFYDIERVEVLRGPQGTLYGEGSFGGVINIISKRPNTEKVEASFSGSWFDTKGGSSDNFDAAGMLNLPLVQDKLALRFVGYRNDHDGYIDAVDVLPIFFGGAPVVVEERANTEKVTGGRVMLSFKPTDKVDILAIYKKSEIDIGTETFDSPNLIATINGLAGTSFEPEETRALFGPVFGDEFTTDEGILEINIETPLGLLTSITGYGDVEQESDGSTIGALRDNEAWSEEIRLSSNNDGAVNWTVGAYYRTVDTKIDVVFGGLGAAAPTPFRVDEQEQWSVFGQVYWNFAPDWTATVGLRYGEQEIKVTDEFNGLPTVDGKFDNLSPKFALDWQMNEDTLVYASIAKGFRAGGANSDESLGTDASFSTEFDSDEVWNYEVGLKTSFWDNRITLNATLFYIDWSDIQIDRAITSLINPPNQFIVVNGEDAHSFGLEADVYFYPAEGWEIVLGGSILEAEYDGGTIDSSTLGLNIPIDGMHLPSSPNYLMNASIERTFPVANNYEAFIRGDFTLRGNSFGDVPNTPAPGGNLRSEQFERLDLRAGLRRDFWELQVYARNVLNDKSSSFNFYDGGFADLHVLLPPRTIGMNIKLRYN